MNHGLYKRMRSFLAQGETNETELTEMGITVPYCGADVCRHGQVTVDDDTKISDVLRRSDPCPSIGSEPNGQCPSRLDEPSHFISVFNGLSLRRLLDIQPLTASTQSIIIIIIVSLTPVSSSDKDIGGVPSMQSSYSAEMKRNGICMKERSVNCRCVGRNPRRHCAGY